MRITRSLMKTILWLGLLVLPAQSYAAIDAIVSFDLFAPPPVAVAPPPLPVYVVPAPPLEGYMWTPGFWRWGPYGYFWVPGTWVRPPAVGVLWTPGYWGWGGGAYRWNEGYWGPHVGFYGGINYGGGYGGNGFFGGGWHGGVYAVDRRYVNVTNVTNVNNFNHGATASFNGGPGGVNARPTPADIEAQHEQHTPITTDQRSHFQAASRNPAFAASANHGRPPVAATARPGDFSHNVMRAQQAGPRNSAAEQHNAQVRGNPSMVKQGAVVQPRVNATPSNNMSARSPTQAPHAPMAPSINHGAPPRPMMQGQHPGAQPQGAQRQEEQRPEAQHPEEARPDMERPPETQHAPQPSGRQGGGGGGGGDEEHRHE